jgi:hypothetical protein
MHLDQFICLLDRYDARFCSSLRSQLRQSRGKNMEELNPNALKEIKAFMLLADKAGVDGAAELADEIDQFLSAEVSNG